MKKAIAIALIILMAVPVIGMMPAKVKAKIADGIQGGNLNAYGYPHLLYYDDSDLDGNASTGDQYFRANMTALDVTKGSITHSYNVKGSQSNDGDYYNDSNYWCEYYWSASNGDHEWKPTHPDQGDTLVAISEMPANGLGNASGYDPDNAMGSGNGINYTYATIYYDIPADANIAHDQLSWYGRYEQIPNYNSTTSTNGTTWLNVSISLPKYTDWNDTGGVVEHRGTFDAWESYAVFMVSPDDSNYANGTGNYSGWYYMGNASSKNVTLGPDSPLAAYEQHKPTDPNTIDTGHTYINITGLKSDSRYYFMVRMNFNFGSNHGGYAGGLGSYTTYVSSGASTQALKTKAAIPEFSTILIPVVAVMGMFLAVTYAYRRKK